MKLLIPFIAAAALLSAVSLTSCERDRSAAAGHTRNADADVDFAKSTFAELAAGDLEVVTKIDWSTLQSRGVNVGAEYAAMKNATDQDEFRSNFVRQFSSAFIDQGGKLEHFTDWRAAESDALKTLVTANSPAGLLKMTVVDRDGQRQVSGIDLVD